MVLPSVKNNDSGHEKVSRPCGEIFGTPVYQLENSIVRSANLGVAFYVLHVGTINVGVETDGD
jgi:hypothetical protein